MNSQRKMEKSRLLILAICVTAFVFGFIVEHSFAQSQSSKIPIPQYGVFIFVQTIVENSEGQIVTYLASDKFSNVNTESLNFLLDSEATEKDPVITIGENKYQIIKRQQSIDHDKKSVIASTIIAQNQNDGLKQVARFAHDGYPVVEGDRVVSIWTFIRPM